ncbi:hemophore-related protein [Mycobacterium sp. ITM-2016-00318]|uniref:hemophore-related protein n=1 Tax=Mycobacterium sp. ITM-2016-00318 TaxID=2099693 RepID=UPI000CF9C916|nr:hemophore-related protein [Mycobacterium sp. ITM-2016-00318]WNG91120.1 hemophore-related protein [Mycobacterium sp. ITM-2016-00318]
MRISGMTMRRGIVGVAAAGALAGLTGAVAMPTASAAPPCDAAGLNTAVSQVSGATAAYLSSHPGANDAITNAGGAGGNAEAAIRNYFVAHPTEWADLQRIASPLRNLRAQCEVDVAPTEIARLFDAMAS